MGSGGPLFISYSRKDYYFAESLAFHLLRRGVRAWLDVKDLTPGGFWERDLEAALDAASCVVLVASRESVKSPNVRKEWERARSQGKRMVIVLRRGVRLPQELTDCEVVDFRGAFAPALRKLISRLEGNERGRMRGPRFWKLPPWILALAITLAIPIAAYFTLANWSSSSEDSAAFEALTRLALPVFALLLLWFLGLSFVRRRMGMTHILVCFAFAIAWTIYPLALFWHSGAAGLEGYASGMKQAIMERPLQIELLGALPLLGLFIVLVVQPEELLRWTPTGRAWGWYRERRAARVAELEKISPLKTLDLFYLLYDPMDGPAADRLRREIEQTGAKEGTNDATAVVLLTNRTREEWLIHNAQQLPTTVITVVGTAIRLPEQFDWLWRREWIDFRHWDINRLDRRNGLPAVPEAVTGTRFPAPVRLAHHLLCSMGGLCMILPMLANPKETDEAQGIAAMALLIWNGVLGRQLLRRTILERSFYRWWIIRVALVACLAAWTFQAALGRDVSVLRAAPLIVFLAVWPVVWMRNRRQLGFWFPSPEVPSLNNAATLGTRRNWQTLLWVLMWYVIWALALGLFNETS